MSTRSRSLTPLPLPGRRGNTNAPGTGIGSRGGGRTTFRSTALASAGLAAGVLASGAAAQVPGAATPTKIPFAARAPAVDGDVDAVWRTVAPHATTRVIFGSPPSAADLSATWRALSDAANLYLLVEVRDDAARNDSADAYQDDSVELYLDVGDDKTGAFGDDDFQFYFRRGVNVVRETRHKATDGVSYKTRSLRGGGGYRMEICLPWKTLQRLEGAGRSTAAALGIDVHVNDDDDGGDRDRKIAWWGTRDDAWQTTRVFGSALVETVDSRSLLLRPSRPAAYEVWTTAAPAAPDGGSETGAAPRKLATLRPEQATMEVLVPGDVRALEIVDPAAGTVAVFPVAGLPRKAALAFTPASFSHVRGLAVRLTTGDGTPAAAAEVTLRDAAGRESRRFLGDAAPTTPGRAEFGTTAIGTAQVIVSYADASGATRTLTREFTATPPPGAAAFPEVSLVLPGALPSAAAGAGGALPNDRAAGSEDDAAAPSLEKGGARARGAEWLPYVWGTAAAAGIALLLWAIAAVTHGRRRRRGGALAPDDDTAAAPAAALPDAAPEAGHDGAAGGGEIAAAVIETNAAPAPLPAPPPPARPEGETTGRHRVATRSWPWSPAAGAPAAPLPLGAAPAARVSRPAGGTTTPPAHLIGLGDPVDGMVVPLEPNGDDATAVVHSGGDMLHEYRSRVIPHPDGTFVLTAGKGADAAGATGAMETLLNGVPLEEKHVLRAGDEIQIGAARFRFEGRAGSGGGRDA